MKSELIVDVQPQEIAIALTEDDRLQEKKKKKRNQDNFPRKTKPRQFRSGKHLLRSSEKSDAGAECGFCGCGS